MASRAPRLLHYALVALLAPPVPVLAQSTPPDETLARALAAAAAGTWTPATVLDDASGGPIATDVALWLRLRDGTGGWQDSIEFLGRNPDWPGLAPIRRAAEAAMPASLPDAAVIAFFDGAPPLSGTGALRLADALAASGETAAAEAEVLRAWRTQSMTGSEQDALVARWGELLAPHHVERLDMLLWRGLTAEAENMLPLVPADWQALARARIAVRRDADGSTAAINAVPAALASDPGLAYERYLWRIDHGRSADAVELLLQHSTSAAALGRPELWLEQRPDLARAALRDGDAAGAYAIAASSFGTSGTDYADSEWLAGYIALTRLDDPARAIAHFRQFQTVVFTPISLGRAGYWLGLALERSGDADAAQAAFRQAAAYPTSFYGQLAAERSDAAADARLTGGAPPPDWRGQPFMRASVVQAATALYAAGDTARAATFLRQAAEGRPAAERAALARLAVDIGAPQIGLRIAKDAAAAGLLLPGQYYPLHPIATVPWPVPAEYALAIARQESEFDAAARSPAGARGLMQLMPATAQQVSAGLEIGYDGAALGADAMYNARLGTAYLADMLDRYDGSYVLATAAYNAGPGRVDKWLATFGDPRTGAVDAIDWIEAIPFDETRNYVMRVLESLHVYRARLTGTAGKVGLSADINRTGG